MLSSGTIQTIYHSNSPIEGESYLQVVEIIDKKVYVSDTIHYINLKFFVDGKNQFVIKKYDILKLKELQIVKNGDEPSFLIYDQIDLHQRSDNIILGSSSILPKSIDPNEDFKLKSITNSGNSSNQKSQQESQENKVQVQSRKRQADHNNIENDDSSNSNLNNLNQKKIKIVDNNNNNGNMPDLKSLVNKFVNRKNKESKMVYVEDRVRVQIKLKNFSNGINNVTKKPWTLLNLDVMDSGLTVGCSVWGDLAIKYNEILSQSIISNACYQSSNNNNSDTGWWYLSAFNLGEDTGPEKYKTHKYKIFLADNSIIKKDNKLIKNNNCSSNSNGNSTSLFEELFDKRNTVTLAQLEEKNSDIDGTLFDLKVVINDFSPSQSYGNKFNIRFLEVFDHTKKKLKIKFLLSKNSNPKEMYDYIQNDHDKYNMYSNDAEIASLLNDSPSPYTSDFPLYAIIRNCKKGEYKGTVTVECNDWNAPEFIFIHPEIQKFKMLMQQSNIQIGDCEFVNLESIGKEEYEWKSVPRYKDKSKLTILENQLLDKANDTGNNNNNNNENKSKSSSSYHSSTLMIEGQLLMARSNQSTNSDNIELLCANHQCKNSPISKRRLRSDNSCYQCNNTSNDNDFIKSYINKNVGIYSNGTGSNNFILDGNIFDKLLEENKDNSDLKYLVPDESNLNQQFLLRNENTDLLEKVIRIMTRLQYVCIITLFVMSRPHNNSHVNFGMPDKYIIRKITNIMESNKFQQLYGNW